MDNCRQRMINDMQLCGYSERTQEEGIDKTRLNNGSLTDVQQFKGECFCLYRRIETSFEYL